MNTNCSYIVPKGDLLMLKLTKDYALIAGHSDNVQFVQQCLAHRGEEHYTQYPMNTEQKGEHVLVTTCV